MTRLAAQERLLADIEAFVPGSENPAIYQRLFKQMTDEDFKKFYLGVKNGEHAIPIIVPEMAKSSVSVARNLALGKEWGHQFFERVWMDGENGTAPFLSNHKYLIVLLPLKRQVQFLVKKISIPEDSRTIDNMTGQVTGKSKGSKFSYPEMQVAASQGLHNTISEFMRVRGGDLAAFNALTKMLGSQGGASLKTITGMNTVVKSQQTLSALLTGMHLANT